MVVTKYKYWTVKVQGVLWITGWGTAPDGYDLDKRFQFDPNDPRFPPRPPKLTDDDGNLMYRLIDESNGLVAGPGDVIG